MPIGYAVMFWKSGAWGRDRTADTVIFSHVLYQLSYPGIAVLVAVFGGYQRLVGRLWRGGSGLARQKIMFRHFL
jgi:hypothetical protein